ncbi:MAG: stage III sporulation protein AF [Syntrophomonadaceae bacterium]|jgi:stage III sporulation protein AF|nr:stage III sporulation protein AF [Syntrophomonadaceae bacterium]
MGVLADVVRNVLVIVIVTSFMELLLPDGTIKPFVRFAVGLFVIIAVLTQITVLFDKNSSLPVTMWDAVISNDTALSDHEKKARIEKQGQFINEKIINGAYQEVRSKMDGQISALVSLVPGVEEVKTDTLTDENHNIRAINLQVVLENNNAGDKSQKDQGKPDNVSLPPDKPAQANTKEIVNKIRQVINNFYGFQGVEVNITVEGE